MGACHFKPVSTHFSRWRLRREPWKAGKDGGPLRYSAWDTSRLVYPEERATSRLLRQRRVVWEHQLESVSLGSLLGGP